MSINSLSDTWIAGFASPRPLQQTELAIRGRYLFLSTPAALLSEKGKQ
jgi:hypothetical protein